MEKDEIQNAVEHKIYIIRGQRVMVDFDLAKLYGVETRILVQSVKRNISRFPEDFAFQLTLLESQNLISQIVISSSGHGGHRKYPHVFTEHGVVMLSSVLKNQRAAQMNIFIVRAFIKIREMLATHADLALKIAEIERKQKEHGDQLSAVYSVVKRLMDPPEGPKKKIGFAPDASDKS